MYKETSDEINDNLLQDFIDSDDENKIIEPKPLSENKKKAKQEVYLDPKIKIIDLATVQQKKFNPDDMNDFHKIKG